MSASIAEWDWCGVDKPLIHETEAYQTREGDLVVGELMNPFGWLQSADSVEVRR
jgi:hypothetical protein